MEAAKAKLQVDDHYLTEAEEEKALLKLMEEGKKKVRMRKNEQDEFLTWLTNQ